MPLFCLKIAYPILYVFQPVTFLTDAAELNPFIFLKMKAAKNFEHTLVEQMKDPEFQEEFLRTKQELAILDRVIQIRRKAGLSQEAVAKRMGTSQSAVARIESGLLSGRLPSLTSLQKYANAVGKQLEIRLV